LIAVLLASCSNKAYLFTSFHEPANEGLRLLYSTDGMNWKALDSIFLQPQVGKQHLMRDPSMVQGPDGVFHLVWTSSWRGDNGFGYASSTDLVHWSKQQFIPVMQHEPSVVNVWAPELIYDEASKKFIIIWASCIPGRFNKGIEEDSNNHRMYITTTEDFKTFSETKLFLDPGFSVIDAVVVKRALHDYVMVLKDNTRPERNLKIMFAENILGPWNQLSKPISNQFTEGPSVLKLHKNWLIYFDSYQIKKYEALSTQDFIHFKNINYKIHLPEGHKHGTIVTITQKKLRKLLQVISNEANGKKQHP
jgi:hypothetical protein